MSNKFDELDEKEMTTKRRKVEVQTVNKKELTKKIILAIIAVPAFIVITTLMFVISFTVFFSGVISLFVAIFGMVFSLEYIENINNIFWMFLGFGNIVLGILMSLGANFVRSKTYIEIKKMLGMEV